MLNQFDIDNMMKSINEGSPAEIYYVANMLETREGILDESEYKSNPKYKVIKVKITDIRNAYFYYVDYLNNKDNYHEEQEEEYYDMNTKYIHYYTVPNADSSYVKGFNANVPSMIFGYRRKLFTEDGIITHIDPSPIKEVYTNRLEICNKQVDWSNDLNWKYMKLDNPAIDDGIEYKYVTSNWFVMQCENFPRTEHILVNTKQVTSYFMNLEDAFNYVAQIR